PIWQVLCKYEHMCSDPGNFFARIISSFNFPVNMDRLHAVISNCTGKIRFNIGIPGRSIRELSEENKALLEQMLIEHPQDLSELLYELPWWPSRRGQSPDAQRYDNALIRSYGTDPESEKLYLIKDGKRRWITSPQWSKDAGRGWVAGKSENCKPDTEPEVPLSSIIHLNLLSAQSSEDHCGAIGKDRVAREVADLRISFNSALSNKRKYPVAEFNAFVQGARRYIKITATDPMIHKSVAQAVNGLRELLEVERKRIPGTILFEADRLERQLFAGYDPS